MRIKLFSRLAAAVVLLTTMGVITASAQVTRIEGKVTLKQADGTEVPVKDAVVDIFRTDISGKFQTKTDKNGTYVHAGIPFGGTYTIAVSAPGARPTFMSGLRLNAQPNNNFTLTPGDGTRLTIDQIKASMATSGAPAAGATPGGESKEARAKREEMEREAARIEEQNKKILASNEIIQRVFKAGNEAFQAKRYDEAITLYDEGIQADPEQSVLYLNKSMALRNRAVDKFNAATKAKDMTAREAAKADFKAAAEASEKAVQLYRDVVSKRSAAAGGGGAAGGAAPSANDQTLNYLAARSENYRLALQTNTPVAAEQAITAIQDYIAAETDPAKKAKAEASLGDALFQGGRIDESIAAYRKILTASPSNLDAMFGLGIALAADPNGGMAAEARDMLQQFASKAPATDPRKQMAEEAVLGLSESLKPKPAEKNTDTNRNTRRRRG